MRLVTLLVSLVFLIVSCVPSRLVTPIPGESTPLLPSTIKVTATPTVPVTPSVAPSITPIATPVELQLTLTPSPPATDAIDGNLRLIRTFNQADSHFDFSPDSRFIAISGVETVGIYDALSEELKVEFEKPPSDSSPGRVVFSPEGSWLAAQVSSDGPNNIYVWNLRDYRLVKQFEFPRFLNLEFSHDGQLLATANQLANLIVIWNLKTGARRDLEALPYEIAFSPKQALLAAAEMAYESTPTVRIWNTTTYQATPLFYQSEPPQDPYGGGVSVDFSSEGNLLAAIVNHQLRIWSLDANQEIDHPLFKSLSNLVQVRASAGGIIAVLDQQGIVTVLNANTGEIVGTTKIEIKPHYLVGIALSPDGHYLLTGGTIQLLQLWEIPQE